MTGHCAKLARKGLARSARFSNAHRLVRDSDAVEHFGDLTVQAFEVAESPPQVRELDACSLEFFVVSRVSGRRNRLLGREWVRPGRSMLGLETELAELLCPLLLLQPPRLEERLIAGSELVVSHRELVVSVLVLLAKRYGRVVFILELAMLVASSSELGVELVPSVVMGLLGGFDGLS